MNHPATEHLLLRQLQPTPATAHELAARTGLDEASVRQGIGALVASGLAITRTDAGYALQPPFDALDAATILAALPASLRPRLARLEVQWHSPSTNSALLAAPPCDGTEVLLAEYQTAGRGRHGRHWVSPPGAGIHLSLAHTFPLPLARLAGLSLVTGIAVAEAIDGLCRLPVRLKWPNDLYLDGRKLGGILLEAGRHTAHHTRLVIGLGLNCRLPEAAARAITHPWTDLAQHLPALPPRNTLVAAVLAHLLPCLDDFREHGLAPFLPRFAARDALAGQAIRVEAGGRTQHARALGIAADGGLVITDDRDTRTLHAGEISIRLDT